MTSTPQVTEYDRSQDKESSPRKNRDDWRGVNPLQIAEYDRLEDEESRTMKIRDFGVCAQLPSMDNAEGEQGYRRKWKRSSAVAALFLLCILLLAMLILLSVQYIKVIGQNNSGYNNFIEERDLLKIGYNNMTEERDQLKASYTNLTEERDQLKASYTNLTEERDQLKASYTNLTEERDQLKAYYTNLIEERDQLKASYTNLTEERDQLNETLNLWKSGWKKFGSSWYFLSDQKNTWIASREDCLKRGAHLVIINSEAEQRFIYGFSGSLNTHIGLHDMNTEGVWQWIDDGPSRKSSTPEITYWEDGEPNNSGGEDCAEITTWRANPLKSWNDIPCTKMINWMCEKTTSAV